MGFYRKKILPKILNREMAEKYLEDIRQEIIPRAKGVVLEIGFGSGLNLPIYRPDQIQELIALEPSAELFAKAKDRIIACRTLKINWLNAHAESIPLPNASVDCVVSTWTMCSVTDPRKVLQEITRVLKPGGEFIFVEHGLSPHTIYRAIQYICTPLTKCFAGGCHLDRNIETLLHASPLEIIELKKFSIKFKPLGYMYQGSAKKNY